MVLTIFLYVPLFEILILVRNYDFTYIYLIKI